LGSCASSAVPGLPSVRLRRAQELLSLRSLKRRSAFAAGEDNTGSRHQRRGKRPSSPPLNRQRTRKICSSASTPMNENVNTQEKWQTAVENGIRPSGNMKSRKPKSIT